MMRITRRHIALLMSLAICHLAAGDEVAYQREVLPILATHCYQCHGPDAEQREAGLRLDQRKAATSQLDSENVAISPQDPAASELLRRITSKGDDRMPPIDSGEALSAQQIATLRTWIDEGASYARHWAFEPLDATPPPVADPAANRSWATNSIDTYIESRLLAQHLAPAPEADRSTLIRRVYFDLLGLPPTPEQVRRFVEDSDPGAYPKVVDELLSSPAYGERWGRHWLDVARYGDSNGGDENHAYPLAHRYRDYVITAFNQDLPYRQFVRQQLAGDLLEATDDEQLATQRLTATGYLAIGMKILAEQDPVKKQADMVDEQIDTFGRTFLGLSLGCARCHDHKFDPIPTRDYYALAGIFHSSAVGDQPLMTQAHATALKDYQHRVSKLRKSVEAIQRQLEDVCGAEAVILREAETFDRGNVVVDKDNYGKDIGIISDPGSQQNFAEYDVEIPAAASYVIQLRYAAAKARPGQLLINGEFVKESAISEATGGWNPDSQSWMTEGVFALRAGTNVVRLQSEPMMSHIDKLRLVRRDQVTSHELDRLDQLSQQLSQLQQQAPKPRMVMAVVDGEATNTPVHLRGSHLNLGEEVPRGFLSILDSQSITVSGERSGRLQLANWLTADETASVLTARVIANRIWQWHFGRGLVTTPDDFGIRGELPTHPRLLDHLAGELIRHDWSIKRLSRLIVTSSTYRMASSVNEQNSLAEILDPANRLYWRRDRIRLDAEALRDAIMFQAGELEQAVGDAPLNVKTQDPSPQDMAANLKKYEASRRRSVYLPVVRSNVYEFLTLFDFPNAASPVGKRDTTTIPTQALWIMNSPFIAKHTRRIAERLKGESPRDAIQHLYRLLFAREATEYEISRGTSFLQDFSQDANHGHALSAYCHVLMASNEYLYLR